MTCIAGIEQDGKVYIGGDSAGVVGLDVIVRSDEKVFQNGPSIFGFSSSFRMGQILRYQLTIPEKLDSMDDTKFVYTLFLEEIRKTLKTFGYSKVDNNVEEGGNFLVGYAGRLYHVESDYQVGRSLDGFAAVGCGAPYALAVLYCTQDDANPERRIYKALQAAEHFSGGVRQPFTILNM